MSVTYEKGDFAWTYSTYDDGCTHDIKLVYIIEIKVKDNIPLMYYTWNGRCCQGQTEDFRPFKGEKPNFEKDN